MTKGWYAAAFGRLCVETSTGVSPSLLLDAAAFGRLCVETGRTFGVAGLIAGQPPSGGCVLKRPIKLVGPAHILPAAFRRLCVETSSLSGSHCADGPSRLQAAAC